MTYYFQKVIFPDIKKSFLFQKKSKITKKTHSEENSNGKVSKQMFKSKAQTYKIFLSRNWLIKPCSMASLNSHLYDSRMKLLYIGNDVRTFLCITYIVATSNWLFPVKCKEIYKIQWKINFCWSVFWTFQYRNIIFTDRYETRFAVHINNFV